MRIIETKVYTFDELGDKAKERARDWYREGGLINEMAWENACEDALQIGLKIESLDQHRSNEGKFMASAEETAHKIEKEHGNSCATYVTAKQYLEARDKVITVWERDENGEFVNQDRLDVSLDALDSNFLHDLLEDYRISHEKDLEYFYSAESVDETIRDNGYEFTIDGKRTVA